MIEAGVESLNVLYIDDDEINLKVVSAMLESVGANLTGCRSPRTGLDILTVQAFDLILIDIHMPEMSGVELLCELRRRSGRNRGLPAIALTADLAHDEIQYRRLGFDGFVAKPLMIRPLLAGMLAALAANARPSRARRATC